MGFQMLRGESESLDPRTNHIRDYKEQKRILPEWYDQQWSVVFHGRRALHNEQDPFTVIGKLVNAEEKNGTVYFTIEAYGDERFSREPVVATFTGPFWEFFSVQ